MSRHRFASLFGLRCVIALLTALLPIAACTTPSGGGGDPGNDAAPNGDEDADAPGEGTSGGDEENVDADDDATTGGDTVIPANLVQPADLEYRGAFRLPEGTDVASWDWGGTALAYYAGGDPDGPDDGYPGSLYGTGHEHAQMVSEVTIPEPVISTANNVDGLNTAAALQDFHDVRGELGVSSAALEQARAGLACLPPLGDQTTGKLYFCWGEHFQYDLVASHGWCELDLSDVQVAGPWYIDDLPNHSTNDFMFEIPADWADAHVAGHRLGTGRFREGGLASQGPGLHVIAPWNEGNPPPPDSHLDVVTLLRYTPSDDWDAEQHTLDGFHQSDDWVGAAWLATERTAAVAVVGTKGLGECWYGFANGVVWPEEGPYPEVPDPPYDNRGYWSTDFAAQILFYDPADLAAVAAGTLEAHEPQPYATLDIEDRLYNPDADFGRNQLGAAACDPDRRLLYIAEFRGNTDQPLIHVWAVGS